MYKILIIEDETAARDNLYSMLKTILGDEIDDVAVCESVTQSVDFLKVNTSLDLIFMDINLADGNAFNIFTKVDIHAPIIFTTAYDEYALKAFAVNSIDYLLKPLHEQELKRAIAKWQNFSQNDKQNYVNKVKEMLEQEEEEKKNFLLQVKDKIITLSINDIAFLYTSNEQVTAHTFDNKTYVLNFTLEHLMKKLNTQDFFRANRQFIVARKCINEVLVWTGSRLKLKTLRKEPEDIIISKLRVPEFKKWLQN
ncbi:MAG: LytTR family DNA-binding domain-containing protein [Rikenellaceae bacterium]